MKKFNLNLLAIAILGTIVAWLTPFWWAVVFPAGLVTFFTYPSNSSAFFSGFFAIAIVWILLCFAIDFRTGGILSSKMAAIFNLPGGWVLALLSGLFAGIIAGFGALTGVLFRQAVA